MSVKHYIYALIDPRDKQVRYVGKTVNLKKRLREHIRRSSEAHTHCQCWIRGLVKLGLKPKMRVLDIATEATWEAREIHWIKVCRDRGCRLTNITDGGQAGGGVKWVKGTCGNKQWGRGSKHKPETIELIRLGHYGIRPSDETRQKQSASKQQFFATENGKTLAESYSKAYGVLTDEQVIEVWTLAWSGELPQRIIAERYGIPQSTVSEIKFGKRYKHVKRPE